MRKGSRCLLAPPKRRRRQNAFGIQTRPRSQPLAGRRARSVGSDEALVEQVQAAFDILGQAIPAGGNVEQGGLGGVAVRLLRPLQRGRRILSVSVHSFEWGQRLQGASGVSQVHVRPAKNLPAIVRNRTGGNWFPQSDAVFSSSA